MIKISGYGGEIATKLRYLWKSGIKVTCWSFRHTVRRNGEGVSFMRRRVAEICHFFCAISNTKCVEFCLLIQTLSYITLYYI